jgi:xanthine dehydrogenase accessory factor
LIPLRTALQHLGQAPAVLVTVLDVRGSVPRGSGTRMLVFADRFAATIGGGHLEFEAIAHARRLLAGQAH